MNPVVSVRMGEFAISDRTDEELAVVGLGSCIALMLIDAASGAIGVAHVVLPTTTGNGTPPTKYAELAVPYLVDELRGLTGIGAKLGAVLVGGAQMFQAAHTMDIGRRNAEAVHDALSSAKIPVLVEDIGGTAGRTARAVVHDSVSVQTIGSPARELLSLKQPTPARPVRTAALTPVTAARLPLASAGTAQAATRNRLSATRSAMR